MGNKRLIILIVFLGMVLAGLLVAVFVLDREPAQPGESTSGTTASTEGTENVRDPETTAPSASENTDPKETEPPETKPVESKPQVTQPKETEPGKTEPTKPSDPVEPTKPEETTPATQPTQKEYSALAQAYIDYTNMSGDAQMKFYYSFADGNAFAEWYKSAKAAYDAETEEIYIGADGVVDAGKD